MDLERDLFQPVVKRIRERNDSLRAIRPYKQTGIEGWFKVEVVAALGKSVQALRNKGPDLLLRQGQEVELKAGTGLSKYYVQDGASKYKCPCLFLADGSDRRKIQAIAGHGFELLAHAVFSDGEHEWVVGLVRCTESPVDGPTCDVMSPIDDIESAM